MKSCTTGGTELSRCARENQCWQSEVRCQHRLSASLNGNRPSRQNHIDYLAVEKSSKVECFKKNSSIWDEPQRVSEDAGARSVEQKSMDQGGVEYCLQAGVQAKKDFTASSRKQKVPRGNRSGKGHSNSPTRPIAERGWTNQYGRRRKSEFKPQS